MAPVFAASAYHPTVVFDWFLENLIMLVFIIALILIYRVVPLSRTSYVPIILYLCFHEWGAHYKYDGVPLGEWIKVWLHTNRNPYDRVLHLLFGLLGRRPDCHEIDRSPRCLSRQQKWPLAGEFQSGWLPTM